MSVARAAMIAVVLLPVRAGAATAPNDLRDLRLGTPVKALPTKGYGGFACAADPSIKLADWSAYQTCPTSADGTRTIEFRYEDSDQTEVAGQPVRLRLMIDNEATVVGLKIDTDPNARLYLRKKAFLFALQVRARFGEDGWTCRQQSPTAVEQPVGGVFIHEHCEKTTESRRLVLDRQLYRDPGQDLSQFTSATQLTILLPGGRD
jgi:hypothetical protein